MNMAKCNEKEAKYKRTHYSVSFMESPWADKTNIMLLEVIIVVLGDASH
jgi:hypothetical protein